jgi:hypothetical protein
MLKRETMAILGALTMFFSLIGCLNKPSETIISSGSFLIDSKGVEFNLDQPLKRKFNSGSVRIELAQGWQPLPPWTSIQLSDGRFAKVAVTLLSEDGKAFTSAILGSAGGMLNARFEPEIPKEASIKKVKITSDVPLMCKRVVWFDFNAE